MFTILVSAVCDRTQFINPSIPNVLYQINSPVAIVNFEGVQDKESIVNNPFDGYSYCGKRNYAIITTSAAIKYDPVKTEFSIYSKDAAAVSVVDVGVLTPKRSDIVLRQARLKELRGRRMASEARLRAQG